MRCRDVTSTTAFFLTVVLPSCHNGPDKAVERAAHKVQAARGVYEDVIAQSDSRNVAEQAGIVDAYINELKRVDTSRIPARLRTALGDFIRDEEACLREQLEENAKKEPLQRESRAKVRADIYSKLIKEFAALGVKL